MSTPKKSSIEKLEIQSANITDMNIDKIAALFPNCITETADENGKLKKAINFEMLRAMLSEDIAEGDEAYEFTWVGKKAAIAEANRPIRKTLRPCVEESVNWDSTENLYIEGDNLEVLKLLQESYLGKVKMIYIDPPYNTGNDFIYRDDFAVSADDYAEESGQLDEDGNRLFKNTDSNGRFHSDWCSMIYSRLMLARNLLADDGLIFISIGDEESDNLRKIADEVFGAANFRNQIVIRRGAKSVQAQFDTWDKLGKDLEYVLLYSKVSTYRFPQQVKELEEARCGGWNNHWRGTDRPTMRYPLLGVTPQTGQWRWGKERSEKAVLNYSKMLLDVGNDNPTQEQIDNWYFMQTPDTDLLRLSANGKPEHYIPPTNTTLLNSSWIDLLVGSSSEITKLFDTKVFDTAKLTAFIKRMLKFATDDAIILDFFSGSATTAHAVMQLNAEDGGHRKFIMVQLHEETDEKSEAFKAGYKNICEIGKERIRRAGAKIKSETGADIDYGFRVLKLDDTNEKEEINKTTAQTKQDDLFAAVDNLKDNRSPLDLLFGTILALGLPLDRQITKRICGPNTIYLYNYDYEMTGLAVCFDDHIDDNTIKTIAGLQPERAVFRDSSFPDSNAKINLGEQFKRLSNSTKIKVI